MQAWPTTLKNAGLRLWRGTRRLRRLGLEIVVAMSLAILVWLYTRSRDHDTLDQVTIPVQIQLAPAFVGHYELEVTGTSRVVASFTGASSRLRELRRKLQRGQVQVAFTLPVPESRQNDSSFRDAVQVEAADIPVPAGVTAVLPEKGNSVAYAVHRLVERHLAVKLDYQGDARVSQVKLEPATVAVRGPKEVVDRMWTINTQACVLTTAPESTDGKEQLVQGQASLVAEWEGRPIQTTPKSISYTCRVRSRQKTYELSDIPVQFLCPPQFAWRPRFLTPDAGKVSLVVRGPASDEPPPVLAFVDLTATSLGSGRNLLPVRVQLPRDYQLVSDTPPQVAFYLDLCEVPSATSQDTPPPARD